MLRKHSSDSDDVPLDWYKTHSSLHKPGSWPCEFCNHISTSIYANFKHNATHIIIPLVNLTLHQCEDCLHHFTSLEELNTHAKVKNHRTSQVPLKSEYDIILQSIIKKQLVVKCHDLFNDIKLNGRLSQNRTEVSKENDSTVSKTRNFSDVIVKSELPTYVISDSDSIGRNSPLLDTEKQSKKKEQRQKKLEVFKTKAEPVNYTSPDSVRENLTNAKGEQSSLHTEGRSETLLHGKWQHTSDSDSQSDVDGNITEDSKMKLYLSDEEIEEVDQSVFKYETLDGNSSPKRSADYEPIRSRLVFEDDLDEDAAEEILPDLPCRVLPNRCLFGSTPSTNLKPNSIILGSQTNRITVNNNFFGNGYTENFNNLKILDMGVEENVLEEYPESVPYETLVKTEICDCRYCGRCFCNRMQLISHEATHLRIRKPRPTLCPFCEKFYAGNYRALRKHLEDKHPEVDPDEKRPQSHVCKVCHLNYYNFFRHCQYYHKTQREENPQQRIFKRRRRKTVLVCDMCLNWCKNGHIYKQIGTHSEIGRTQKCCKCQNRHFSINLVTRRRFQKEEANKRMSNEERLRRIKKKLKMIKRMNKCFWACFIYFFDDFLSTISTDVKGRCGRRCNTKV